MADLESLTKDELIAQAEEQGVEVSSSWTKAEILAALQGNEGDFTTPRHTFTAVTGRDQLTDEQKEAIIAEAAAGGTADQGSLGGTGGTTITGGAGAAPAGGGPVTTGPA